MTHNARMSTDLFDNSRVVLEGRWRYGYFCMVAVGATNVGSININCDPDLSTNRGQPRGVRDVKEYQPAPTFDKGDRIGHFSFGSSIVLLFEAPEGLQFTRDNMTKVKYGQHLL